MAITKAVASSVKTPGLYLLVNLLGAAANPGTAVDRVLIMAPKSSAGNITANTEVRRCNGADQVATALGPGTPGHLAAKRLFARHGIATLDVIAPTASAGSAATATQTFTGPATENSTIRFRIHGRTIDVAWLSGEAATAFVTRAVAAINEHAADLFVTAVDGGSGDIDYTAKIAGPFGNDVLINAAIYEGGGGIAVSVNPTALTGGTTEPDFATALSTISTVEYRRIIACLSNADAAATASSSNGEKLANYINSRETGASALLQVGVVGVTGSVANAKAGAIDRNNEAVQYLLGRSWDDLPYEIAGAVVGETLKKIADRPNFNLIGTRFEELYGPRDVVTNRLSDAETEDLLNNGVSPMNIDGLTGVPFLVAPITTHSVFSGAPDYRAFHLSGVDGMYTVFADMRTALPQEFPNASITEDLGPGADPLPAGVVEIRDVRAFVISRLRSWVRRGVVSGPALDAAIENEELVVEIDESDPSQVNIFLPTKIIPPLSKFSVVGSRAA